MSDDAGRDMVLLRLGELGASSQGLRATDDSLAEPLFIMIMHDTLRSLSREPRG